MPRVAPGWQMPATIAAQVRAAVVSRRADRRLALGAFLLASLCFPIGPVVLDGLGLGAWLACLALWFCMIALAARSRSRSRRRLRRELSAARAAFVRERYAMSAPPSTAVHVRIAEASEPETPVTAQDEDVEREGELLRSAARS